MKLRNAIARFLSPQIAKLSADLTRQRQLLELATIENGALVRQRLDVIAQHRKERHQLEQTITKLRTDLTQERNIADELARLLSNATLDSKTRIEALRALAHLRTLR